MNEEKSAGCPDIMRFSVKKEIHADRKEVDPE